MTSATGGLAEDLGRQHAFVHEREPAYGRLLELLSSDLPTLAPRLEAVWIGRPFFAWYERPLLLLASLRNDALAEGRGHPLWAYIGTDPLRDRLPSADELRGAMREEREGFWRSLSERAVQTNETTRAVAWLWPAALIASRDPVTPLHLADIGTSAGLNLVADNPSLDGGWSDGSGEVLPTTPLPPLVERLGLDLSPVDVKSEDDARWLLACVWPSDSARSERLLRGVDAYRRAMATPGAPRLEACGIDGVAARLHEIGVDGRLLALQTIMRDYLSPGQQAGHDAGMRALLESRAPGAALWVELEVDPRATERDRTAQLRAHVREADGGVATLVLAATHPHPRTLFVEPEAVRRLCEAIPTRAREP